MTPIEVTHAVHFLKYASIHAKYRKYPSNKLIEHLLSEEVYGQRKLTSALVELVAHPSNTLQTVSLSFLDVNFSSFSKYTSTAVTVTELLSQLLKTLNPHELPLNGTTIDFHRQLTSTLDNFFNNFTTEDFRRCLGLDSSSSRVKSLQSQQIDTIITSSLKYFRTIIAAPVFPTDTLSGFSLLSTMTQFDPIMIDALLFSGYPEIQRFFGEIQNDIVEELVSMLGLPSTDEAELCLRYDRTDPQTTDHWLKGFEYLLGRVSERTVFSDLEMLTVAFFLNRRPSHLKLFFYSDDRFGLKMNDDILSSTKLDLKAFWTLFTPTQPSHAAAVLTAFNRFINHENGLVLMKSIWSDWFPNFINAVDPSKLPFTSDFIPFHVELIDMLQNHLNVIQSFSYRRMREWSVLHRNELDETYHAFYTHTKDYVVHLSLHPFALDNYRRDVILEFLVKMNQPDIEDSLNKPYREDVRKAMDACALSSSSHLNLCVLSPTTRSSTSSTELLLCWKVTRLSCIHLPKLFRKAGRSPEQFFHAFECLLSLPIDSLDQSPINYLLTTRRVKQPRFDEWDDVDFERIGILKRLLSQIHHSVASDPHWINELLFPFVFGIIPRARHCAARLCQSQLDRLLAPSVDVFSNYFIQLHSFTWQQCEKRKEQFVDACKLCDQRVIARCLSRNGYFSRFVTALFDQTFEASEFFFRLLFDRHLYPKLKIEDQNTIRRTFPHFLEEGWQDALEFVYVKKAVVTRDPQYASSQMMLFFGANFYGLRG